MRANGMGLIPLSLLSLPPPPPTPDGDKTITKRGWLLKI